MRGYSLEQDLRLLINNPKYSDLEILCEDEEKLYGCRAILAARSDVFDGLLYNGMKESYENKISLPTINYFAMEIILEYTYTGLIKEESITKDNIIETWYAADYFQLLELQDFIIETFKNTLENECVEDYLPELLSKAVKTMPLTEDNIFLNLLIDAVAAIPLNTIEFDRLSIAAFQYFLSFTHEKERLFATPEYEVFRYGAILAAKQVSNNAYNALLIRLPTLEEIENPVHKIEKIENNYIADHRKVTKELEPLIKFIDLKLIRTQILAEFIEPLGIIPIEAVLSVYRHKALLNSSDLNDIRGRPYYGFNESNFSWDESACGSNLIVEHNKKVVHASKTLNFKGQSVIAKVALENKNISSIFEWDVIIEKNCQYAWVGVCSTENFNCESWAGKQPTGWVLGSSGICYTSNDRSYYCPSFGDGTKITVHLDMNKRTCAFTINGIRYPEVAVWNNLPSKLYPVASLCYPGRLRIQYHQKT
ncbi:hypothetical protein RclHR1_00500025 [Rhizophagus clarus]|uniref:BTB domain-containing protein n=1 Tax=Rhizophagus clarus TaxID=94130 RepID=A0A2Z6SDE8_9GLOM|nr:hypothetical protein RclHR1_00500025 [Rhizophagus clarus]GES97492.1 hypothetical protein GLOIN_2v358653 [Rhizophagus clarus]